LVDRQGRRQGGHDVGESSCRRGGLGSWSWEIALNSRFKFLFYDYDLFAARRRGRDAARRRGGGLRAGAAIRAAPEQPDPPPVGDLVGRLASDPAGQVEFVEAALDVADGLADLGGEGLVGGPTMVLVPGP